MKKTIETITVFTFSIIFVIIIAQFIFINNLVVYNSLSFENEDVIITVNEENANFYARYGMKNYGKSESYMIILPFALKPWNVSVLIDEETIDFVWTYSYVEPELEIFDAIIFEIEIDEMESKDIEVTYQRDFELITENSSEKIVYRYIVGSTRTWLKPLNYAHFEFWFESEIGNKQLVDTRDYSHWMPVETFLIFEYLLG